MGEVLDTALYYNYTLSLQLTTVKDNNVAMGEDIAAQTSNAATFASTAPSDRTGPTGKLCNWTHSLTLSQVPKEVQERAKYLILDGIACALLGAHLPWSETAAKPIFEMESSGPCSVFGWGRTLGPLAAALLNSTFIQGFELDDYHSEAPLHSNAILLPAILAAAEFSDSTRSSQSKLSIDGGAFLLAAIVGYEIGPRSQRTSYTIPGLALRNRLCPSASAAAVSKLLGLGPNQIEDALGTACTQACGLMSAQYESMAKRMQHGFAARNGLFAALMSQGGYTGIQRVYERPYGGFLATFSQGSGKIPQYKEDELVADLGVKWQTSKIRVKPYAAMATTHPVIECIAVLQTCHPLTLYRSDDNLSMISSVRLEMSEAAYKHGGFPVIRPVTATGAQMSASYIAALQLVDGHVLPSQFRASLLDRDNVWAMVAKTSCVHTAAFDDEPWHQRVTITMSNGQKLVKFLEAPKGVRPGLTNKDILDKWRAVTQGVIDSERQEKIENLVLGLETVPNVASKLRALLQGWTGNPIRESERVDRTLSALL
ncbi:Cis-aconitate decarboxylase [Lachnellula suecica]|uniref:Cis-aconitate decarboxylase n=1 Tax=Lachnellula suecica TaxID=602035 RepID=A0A8T9CFI2_9HELO|nr:Cis-aconitate decarboxylase [Lachnellula suecica]